MLGQPQRGPFFLILVLVGTAGSIFLKSKSCWDSSGVNFKMLFDLILELQFAVTSVLQPSMAVEPDKNHESREELGRPGNLVKS